MKKFLACVLSILMLSPYAYCADVGKVTYVEGRVDVSKAGSELAVPLRDGDEIAVGDAIRTKAGSKAEVKFGDGSTIRLAQNSRVEIQDYEFDNDKRKTATIKLDRGKVRTIIARMPNSTPFNILTPNSEGQVKGSDIFTFYQAGSSGMLVAEGNLALKSVTHPETSISIPAGSSAFIDIAGVASRPRPYLELEKKMHEQDTYIPPMLPKKGETAVIKGVLAKLTGTVKITPKDASIPHDANINEILGEGDTIETGDNGMVEIKFDNGCGLSLKPNTQIKITRLVIDPKTGVYQNLFESSKGKIKARIENLKGKSTFEIKTPTAICGARGTLMYLEITPAMVKAFFEGGNGYLNNLISGAQTDVGMGYNGSSDDQGNNSNPNPTTNEERDNWTQGWSTGDDTAGYSSGDSDANDNLGDTGDNQGGNNANNDNGTDDNNGNPYVYIPPEPAPAPSPAASVAPVMSLIGEFDKVGSGGEGDGAFGQYYTGDGMVFDTYSSMSAHIYGEGNLWGGISMPFAVFGKYSNPSSLKLWGI
ncbi:MAG: FecR family protein, partial [Candidatus Omnitrophota bacterium]|nr:FecR family protein [Candidatus Omnitrophota bacterium]